MNDTLNFKSITTYRLRMPLNITFSTAKGEVSSRDTIIVRIEDMNGYVGYGECVAFTEPFYTQETTDLCWKKLVDDYVFNLRLMRPGLLMTYIRQLQVWLKRDAMPMTAAALENALIHLHCERQGMNSVAFIMEQRLKPFIENGIVIGRVPMTELLPAVQKHVDAGCRRIKLKVSPEDGYERASLIREHFPHITLAVDANRSYSFEQLPLVRRYNDLYLACIEEPFAFSTLADYKDWRLERQILGEWGVRTPICLDESVLSYDDLSYAVEHDIIDVLNVKVSRFGGLIPTKAAIDLCRSHNIPYWIGSMVESGISKIMHVQLAALGDTYMAGDLSDSKRYFKRDIIHPPIEFSGGIMTVPDGDGLGVTVLEDILELYCVEKRTL